ncbi:response regulator (plasmid) [Rhizobium sp. YTU87027]
MIVEDDALIATDLREIVSNLGYEVSGIADSFVTARLLAPVSTIALVDLNLKDGATGLRVGQYLASNFGIEVVMVTASSEAIQDDLPKVIGLISKPVHPTLIKNVLDYLRRIREGGRGVPPAGMRLFV